MHFPGWLHTMTGALSIPTSSTIMNTAIPVARQGFYRLCVALLACLMCGTASAAPEASVQQKQLKLTLSADRRRATVVVPAGCTKVTLLRYRNADGWTKVATRKVKQGKRTLALPKAPRKTRWRVVGSFPVPQVQRKFPAGFYKGKNTFKPRKQAWQSWYLNNRLQVNDTGMPPGNATGDESGDPQPVEADIWKTDGSLVFFFNQLRGLQVLDVSDPADPRLLATSRIHAEGEDLYLLPDSGGGKNLLLITRHYRESGDSFTRFRTMRFAGGALSVLHNQAVDGALMDSRMAGDRLFLATTAWVTDPQSPDFWAGKSTTMLSEWIVRPEQKPLEGATFSIPGENPVIAAGPDWLAVAVMASWDDFVSDVTVFSLGRDALTRLNTLPLRTSGRIDDKFKIQWRNHVLTTISERFHSDNQTWAPTTVLENFRVWGPDVIRPAVVTDPFLGRLELAAGESLYATRFAGNKAYVVTFLQTDPLWVVDLSDPAQPVVAGHLEIPGWSTHLEPIGDLLFSVGFESGTVAASLFDVADPSAPKLLRRVNLGPPGSFSEATWDEQALRVLPDAGLAMIPLGFYDQSSGRTVASVELLDLDLAARDLRPRGAIRHAFDARRSALLDRDTVLSLSQRVLVAADIADRDHPKLLSEVALAWPVDFVVDGGSHLVQIESGSASQDGRATARISPADDTEAILVEIDLGDGAVQHAEIRNGMLHVLRLVDGRAAPENTADMSAPSRTLHLDLYDVAALPRLPLIGHRAVPIDPGQAPAPGGLLWPHDHRPCVLLESAPRFWWVGLDSPGIAVRPQPHSAITADAARMISPDPFPGFTPESPPQWLAFDVSNPGTPAAAAPLTLGSTGDSIHPVFAAADGLAVIGSTHNRNWYDGKPVADGKILQSLLVVEVPPKGQPRVRIPIDLPGDLVAVGELDRNGFLAYCRSFDENGGSSIHVCASDGADAFLIASVDVGPGAVNAAGRRVFVAADGMIKRHRLRRDGIFADEPALPTRGTVHALRVVDDTLLAATADHVFACPVDAQTIRSWAVRPWSFRMETITLAANGDLLLPLGGYGAQRIRR